IVEPDGRAHGATCLPSVEAGDLYYSHAPIPEVRSRVWITPATSIHAKVHRLAHVPTVAVGFALCISLRSPPGTVTNPLKYCPTARSCPPASLRLTRISITQPLIRGRTARSGSTTTPVTRRTGSR